MQTCVSSGLRSENLTLKSRRTCQVLVRFCAYLRIKPHAHYLCGSPSIHLSFNLAVVLAKLDCFRCDTENKFPTSNTHRLRHGLRGYLILFATHAFVLSVSNDPESSFRNWYFSNIYEFLPLMKFAFLIILSKSFDGSSRVKLWDFTTNFLTTYELFKPSNSELR